MVPLVLWNIHKQKLYKELCFSLNLLSHIWLFEPMCYVFLPLCKLVYIVPSPVVGNSFRTQYQFQSLHYFAAKMKMKNINNKSGNRSNSPKICIFIAMMLLVQTVNAFTLPAWSDIFSSLKPVRYAKYVDFTLSRFFSILSSHNFPLSLILIFNLKF